MASTAAPAVATIGRKLVDGGAMLITVSLDCAGCSILLHACRLPMHSSRFKSKNNFRHDQRNILGGLDLPP